MVTTILSKLVKGNQKGSSALMELIIVMIFVAALIAFVVPTYYQYINKAKLTLAHSTLESINDDLIS